MRLRYIKEEPRAIANSKLPIMHPNQIIAIDDDEHVKFLLSTGCFEVITGKSITEEYISDQKARINLPENKIDQPESKFRNKKKKNLFKRGK